MELVDENEGYYDEEDEGENTDKIVDVFAGETLPAFSLGSLNPVNSDNLPRRKPVYKEDEDDCNEGEDFEDINNG